MPLESKAVLFYLMVTYKLASYIRSFLAMANFS